MEKSPLNFAILGTSSLCERYARAIEAAGEHFYAVCSRRLESAQGFAAGRAKACDNLEQLLQDPALDAVYVCLPNSLHAAAAEKALLAGKHVLCEKPVTVAPQEYASLCAAADAAGKCCAEAVMNFYSPLMPALRERLQAEPVVSARLDYSQRSRKLDAVRQGKAASSFSRELGGGALNDLGVYPLHFAVGLFGAPQQILATARAQGGVDGSAVLLLRYATFDVVLTASKTAQGRCGSEILCDRSAYTFENLSILAGAARWADGQTQPLDSGFALPGGLPGDPAAADGVQERVVRRFACWARGQDRPGYLALREQSRIVQDILAEAHRQIGY